jgi:hypothetical protein
MIVATCKPQIRKTKEELREAKAKQVKRVKTP